VSPQSGTPFPFDVPFLCKMASATRLCGVVRAQHEAADMVEPVKVMIGLAAIAPSCTPIPKLLQTLEATLEVMIP
jgi:hypothetical protein